MAYLLDTNVIVEPTKPSPDARVLAWLAATDARAAHLSVATIAEITQGAKKAGPRGSRYTRWLEEDLLPAYEDRILPVDGAIAHAWGAIRGEAMARGRTIPVIDALIAATARVHGLTVVSRNLRDVDGLGVPVLNPWET